MTNHPLASLFRDYQCIVVFDCETSGLDPKANQIIELAAIQLYQRPDDGIVVRSMEMDAFIRLPTGQRLPENIVELTSITDEILESVGHPPTVVANRFTRMLTDGPALLVAHNAQFDVSFAWEMLRRAGINRPAKVDYLDTLTVFRDRRRYPHKLSNAITAYRLGGIVQNSHRAIDDVRALYEVLKAMAREKDNLSDYINLFGYNPKYGPSYDFLPGVRYEPQPYGQTRPLVERVMDKMGAM